MGVTWICYWRCLLAFGGGGAAVAGGTASGGGGAAIAGGAAAIAGGHVCSKNLEWKSRFYNCLKWSRHMQPAFYDK